MEFPSFFVLRQSGYRANGDLRASVLHSMPVSFPSFTSGVFVSVSRCRSQTADRRWVWRVIPLHLSINPETISSVPLQNVKASLRRWVHHLLSQVFPSSSHQKHINTSCAITFYCPFFPPSVGGGPTAPPECGRVWDQKKCKKKIKIPGKGSVWNLQEVTGLRLCRRHHPVSAAMGHVPQISCLIGMETLKEMTPAQLPSPVPCQREREKETELSQPFRYSYAC